jgi:cation transport ATPase
MNSKTNIPQVVMPGKNYSFWADMKVNGWIFASWPTIFWGDLWLYNHEDCPFMLRVIIALIPLAMCLLWIRGVARWIRGMDELHRRITLDACLFAITWTFFVITAWQHLKHKGILEAIFRSSHYFLGELALGFNLAGLTEYDFYYPLAVMLLLSFYFLGHTIFNRRYK